MKEPCELCFLMGYIFAGYDRVWLKSEGHIDEVLEIHAKPLDPSPEALKAVRKIAVGIYC